MSSDGSIAPRERVNITYRSETNGANSEKELPFRLLMIGDYTLREDETPVENRKPVSINKENFNSVMREQGLGLCFAVPNRLSGDGGEGDLAVSLEFASLKSFEPEHVVRQVPALADLLAIREALVALKGPLSSVPNFRRKLAAIVNDEAKLRRVLNELGLPSEEKPGVP